MPTVNLTNEEYELIIALVDDYTAIQKRERDTFGISDAKKRGLNATYRVGSVTLAVLRRAASKE